ncbi:NAD(P)-dependent oxidoreductase [Ornithinimicrobium cavernae]|uniref:NAD(P)-dependent oxidoreductase n=1 Tax=Ornithinimicrobium cavernae TaxID=2666047 RepID=UPI0012B17C04|nr:NAD(P)-binding oxidoreductase [Ornithinimicrobium cavernae]
MRVTVIAAAGRLGRVVVDEALLRGHEVTGLARQPDRVTDVCRERTDSSTGSGPGVAVDRLTLVAGDARDGDAVRRAVAGADAVISTVSGGSRTDPHRAAEATLSLVRALQSEGVRRLVLTSAYPIVARRPVLVMALLRRTFATAYADAARAEEVVRGSALDWTIVRLNRLVDGPPVGPPTLAAAAVPPRSLTRVDTARLLLDLAEGQEWVSAAVNVGGARRRGRVGA